MENEIQLILDGLAQRSGIEGGVLNVQASDGEVYSAKFDLLHPASEQDIRWLEHQYQIKLPQEYKSWLNALVIANGSSFWDWAPLMLYRTIDDSELKVKDWLLPGFTN